MSGTEKASSIEDTLQERGNRYGVFSGHAKITQALKLAMVDSPNWDMLEDDQKEALEMVAHKIGRILNGDPNYHDSWHDIIGYTKLVADRLAAGQSTPEASPVTAVSPPPADLSKSCANCKYTDVRLTREPCM